MWAYCLICLNLYGYLKDYVNTPYLMIEANKVWVHVSFNDNCTLTDGF
jgi:hypothetical protein